jgi:hypothetical protein
MYRIAFRLMKLARLGLFSALFASSVALLSAAPAALWRLWLHRRSHVCCPAPKTGG